MVALKGIILGAAAGGLFGTSDIAIKNLAHSALRSSIGSLSGVLIAVSSRLEPLDLRTTRGRSRR